MIALIVLVTINLISFAVFGIDKNLARSKSRRIPEGDLLLLVAIGGSVGAVVGMKLFRHKTSKQSFNRRLWTIIALQPAVLALAYFASR